MRKNNPIADFISNFTTRQLVTAAIIGAVLVLGGAGYLVYSRFYGNIGKIKLVPTVTSDIDRKKVASENNIITGYLFSRTKHLMLEEGPDGILIPSQYTIAGRLVTQPAENTLTYRLEDQSMLLKAYVKNGERGKAAELRNEINKRFAAGDGSYYAAVYDEAFEGERTLQNKKTNTSQIAWLDAYLEFAASFGNNDDEKKIRDLGQMIFDENGAIKPETFTVEGFTDADAPGLVDDGDVEDDKETVETGDGKVVLETVTGVKLSDVNLPLIKNLESNGYLPQGSFDKAAKIVTEGLISDSIRLYAYAYEMNGDEINYVYTTGSSGTVDVAESLKTEANLAAMGLLPASDIPWISQEILNTGMIPQYYYVTSGNFSEDQSFYDAAYSALLLAYRTGDTSLYKTLTTIEGMRVATKSTSVALYMIYRQEESRFTFDAAENLGVYLACG